MSTDYVLVENDDVEVWICEHSCKFDLATFDNNTNTFYRQMDGLTLDQLKHMNQQLTNVISYFDSDYAKCEIS